MTFWKTTFGLFIKRLFYTVAAQASLVLYTGVVNNNVNWDAVAYAAVVQLLYVVMTTTRDYRDPTIPNVEQGKY